MLKGVEVVEVEEVEVGAGVEVDLGLAGAVHHRDPQDLPQDPECPQQDLSIGEPIQECHLVLFGPGITITTNLTTVFRIG